MELIKKIDYNLILLVAYVVKCLAISVSFADSFALLILASPILLKRYLKAKEPKAIDSSLVREVDALKKDVIYLKSELSAANVSAMVKAPAPAKKYFG